MACFKSGWLAISLLREIESGVGVEIGGGGRSSIAGEGGRGIF